MAGPFSSPSTCGPAPPVTASQGPAWLSPRPPLASPFQVGPEIQAGIFSQPQCNSCFSGSHPLSFLNPSLNSVGPQVRQGSVQPDPLLPPGLCHTGLLFPPLSHSHNPARSLNCLHTLPLPPLTLLTLAFAFNSSMPLPPGSLPCCLWLGWGLSLSCLEFHQDSPYLWVYLTCVSFPCYMMTVLSTEASARLAQDRHIAGARQTFVKGKKEEN